MTREEGRKKTMLDWCLWHNSNYMNLGPEAKAYTEKLAEAWIRKYARDDSPWDLHKYLKARLKKGASYIEEQLKNGKTLADVKKYLTTVYEIMDDLTAFNNFKWPKWDYSKKFELEDLRKLGDYTFRERRK